MYNKRNMAKTAKRFAPLTVFSDWKDLDDDNLIDSTEESASESGCSMTSIADSVYGRRRRRRVVETLQPYFLIMHPALTSIAFRPETSGGRHGVCEDAYLRCDTKADAPDPKETYPGSLWLHAHPLVQRSFATDVPSSTIIIGRTAAHRLSRGRLRRSTGVTIFDVVAAYHGDLDVKLSSWELTTFVSDEFDFCGVPRGWTDSTLFERCKTLRDLFAIYSFAEFTWDGTIVEDGPLFWVDLKLTLQ
ncbi:hypothetical protein C8Q78DRAFT_1005553 [Trametes maxima]|nr:hypothetical protein C8Q78DRAFT_1005553 [Trametes maxima]